VEDELLLGANSKLENSARMGQFGTPTTAHEKQTKGRRLRVREHLRELGTAKREADCQHGGTLTGRVRLRRLVLKGKAQTFH